jgi:hypothetical protein
VGNSWREKGTRLQVELAKGRSGGARRTSRKASEGYADGVGRRRRDGVLAGDDDLIVFVAGG